MKTFFLFLLLAGVTAFGAVTYSYDAAGRLTKVDYGNGSVISYSYDLAGNLLGRTVAAGAPPPTCNYAINPGGQAFASTGSNGVITITVGAGCVWTAVSNVPWVTFSGSATGSANGSVAYTVAANAGAARTGTVSVAGLVFTIDDAQVSQVADTLEGVMAVHLDILSPDGASAGHAEARVSRRTTGINRDGLRGALYDITRQMLADMNVELEFQIRRTLKPFLQDVTPEVAPVPVQKQDLPSP